MNRCRSLMLLVPLVLSAVALNAQPPVTLSPLTQNYVRVNSPRVVLAHVRVIDGTGKPAVDDQNVVIEGGKIVAVQPGADVASSNGVTVLDLRGYTRDARASWECTITCFTSRGPTCRPMATGKHRCWCRR